MPSGVPSDWSRDPVALLVAEHEFHHRIAGRVELRHQHGLKTAARRNGNRQERVGLIQHRPAVACGARTGLEIRRVDAEIRREILEEARVRAFQTRCGPAGNPGGCCPVNAKNSSSSEL